MSFSYDRSYTLTIEDAVEFVDQESMKLQQEYPQVVMDGDLTSTSVKGTVITDLHMDANVSFDQKSTSSNPNNCTINVYNLSKETRDRVSKEDARVVLQAGYGEEQSIIFTGQVVSVSTVKNNQDLITTFECKDGKSPLDNARFSKSYPKGTQYTTIFRDVIEAFRINGIAEASGGIDLTLFSVPYLPPPSDVKVEKGWGYTGFLRGAMEKLCKEFMYTYQIVHSRLYVYPKLGNKVIGVVELDENNIISIRERRDNTKNTTSAEITKTNTVNSIELKILLDGRFNLTSQVKIKNTIKDKDKDGYSEFLDKFVGDYKISSMSHSLSYEGNEWYTTLKCEALQYLH